MKTFLLIFSLFWAAVASAADPLSWLIRTTYPSEVKTVLQAAEYLTEHTGYRVVVRYPAPLDSLQIASQPVPPIAHLNRTMSVSDALLVLIGNDNSLVVDQEHKLLSFTGSNENEN